MNEPEKVDPWVVQAPKQIAQVANGFHLATFKGVETIKLPTTGEERWRWTWEVQKGEEKGKIASSLTDCAINHNTLPGKLIAGLLGRPILPGENVQASVDACKGKVFLVVVQEGPKGGKPGVKSVGEPPPQM